jgi:hypothetical protein
MADAMTENCNPVDPYTSDPNNNACCPGLTCEVTFDAQGDTVCQTGVGTLGQGSPCTAFADCKSGYRCTLAVAVHECRKFCVLGSSSGCPSGTNCVQFEEPAYDGKVELGLCSS